jgi:hypothetical protein
MKISKGRCRSNGEGLVVIIIMLAIVGGGILWLYSHKKALDRDARAFGREIIQKLTVEHDVNFFVSNLSPQTRLNYPPSQVQVVQMQFTQLGAPQTPLKIDEQVTFESQFFEPKGYFTAHLLYPTGPAEMQVAVSHPVGKWQVDDMTFTMQRGPR